MSANLERRRLVQAAGMLAAAPLLTSPLLASPLLASPAPGAAPPVTPSNAPPAPLPMDRRRLGALEVSAIGLGVQNMSRRYETTVPSRPEMLRIIRAAFDRGITLFDAAEAYGPFEVERILGEGVSAFRDRITIATKFGWNIDQATGRRLPGLNSKPAHIVRVVDGMLQRLRTDRIDLLYQHRVDPEVPIEDVAGAIGTLVAQGKVLHWGLCEMGLDTLRRAHATLPVSAVESEYSMLWRGPEQEVLALCAALGIGFAPEHLPHNLQLVALCRTWGERKQASPGQVALAWLLAQAPWIVPIPGTTEMAHLLENADAASTLRFTASELAELNAAVRAITVHGQRLPDAVLAFSGVEAPPKR